MSKIIKINKNTEIDLPKLIGSRLLIQANSGGGKSWLIRRILEQSHGKVQQIVLDLEGEFSTLREKYDYILAAREGDTQVSCKSAALLAEKLLELNVSAIIDLYELPAHERKRFVKLFLDAMMNAPKKLWHPVLVIVDEAHVFCPEKGESEAASSVIDLCTRGRKRGYCAVLATQRLSKLHKDAAAECNNKLIGRTGLDIDRKRASEELGFTTKEQNLSLRDLEAGEFYAFGTAISRDVIKVEVGEVSTTHPKAGMGFKVEVAPPTQKMKAIIGQLSDLPEEAEKKAKTMKDLQDEISTLKRHRCPAAAVDEKSIEVAVKRAVAQNENEWRVRMKEFVAFTKKVRAVLAPIASLEIPEFFSEGGVVDVKVSSLPAEVQKVRTEPKPQGLPVGADHYVSEPKEVNLTGGALRMAKVLASRYPMKMSKTQLATFSKMKPSSGTYGTYLAMIRTGGYCIDDGGLLIASDKALQEFGSGDPLSSGDVIEMWKGVLTGGAKRMFEVLVMEYPNALSKEDLAEATQMSASSGTFGTYLSTLNGNNLIEKVGNSYKIKDEIYE